MVDLSVIPFFIAGGTIPPGSPSYVERAADRELFEALERGEYCYVLNSRQMGKSSLAVRTVTRLNASGIRTAFVDLTRIGGANVTSEQWYTGLLVETGRALGMRSEAVATIREQASLGPAQRFLGFLHEAALAASASPLVVMIDEIDAVRSLGFSTDELFAGIRQLHNGRATEPMLKNLTFCLLGAALPGDLIRDARTTPFNIGRRIELRDFTPQEARPLAEALGPGGESNLNRVLYWTGGHPFLTQAICAELVRQRSSDIDALVKRQYLDERAKDNDSNLADIGNRLLGRGDPGVGDKERADTLSLYMRLLRSGILDDESNPSAARIKMSGVSRLENGRLRIRNRIYAQVFDKGWIRANMPGQELRRQRKAFWLGALRTTAIAFTVIAIIGALAWNNALLARQFRVQRDRARYDAYVALMSNMNEKLSESNLLLISQALEQVKGEPWAGWEWKYWHHIANRQTRTVKLDRTVSAASLFSPDGKRILVWGTRDIRVFECPSGRLLRVIPSAESTCVWLRDSRRFLSGGGAGDIRLFDAVTGRLIWERLGTSLHFLGQSRCISLLGDRTAILRTQDLKRVRLDLGTGAYTVIPDQGDLGIGDGGEVSRDGRLFVWLSPSKRGLYDSRVAFGDPETGRIVRPPLEMGSTITALALTNDGRFAAVAVGERLFLIDVRSGAKADLGLELGALVINLEFSEDGSMLLLSGTSRESMLVKLVGGKAREMQRFRESGAASFVPGGKEICVTYWDMRFYDIDASPETPEFHVPVESNVFTGAGVITPDGDVIVSDGVHVARDNLLSNSPPKVLARPQLYPTNDGSAWIENHFNRLRILDPVDFKPIADVPTKHVTAGWTSRDAHLFVSQIDNQTIGIYRTRSSAAPLRIPSLSGLSAACFSTDDRYLWIGFSDGLIVKYRVPDGKMIWNDHLPQNAAKIEVSPNGDKVAEVSYDDCGMVWDAKTGRRLVELVGHSQAVCAVAWSPDGKRLATGGDDQTVRMWDAETGACLGIIGRHLARVSAVRFLSGGRTLASFSIDGVVKLWMTENRR